MTNSETFQSRFATQTQRLSIRVCESMPQALTILAVLNSNSLVDGDKMLKSIKKIH